MQQPQHTLRTASDGHGKAGRDARAAHERLADVLIQQEVRAKEERLAHEVDLSTCKASGGVAVVQSSAHWGAGSQERRNAQPAA
jgi:hypothetical protein